MPTVTSTSVIGPDETPAFVSQGGNIYNAETFDKIVPCVRRAIHNGSGGQQLENADVGKIVIRNGSGNSLMFIGGIGNLAPFSGRGMSLYANETMTVPVKNMNQVSVMATTSGEYIECIGFLSGPDPEMDVSGIFIPPDETPPTITSVVPISGISGAAVESEISVLFSECMNPETITTTQWTVRISGDSTNVSGIVSADPLNCALFYFQAYSGTISGETMYVSRIAGGASGVRDIAGNAMTISGRWHWTTASGFIPDITKPNISGTNPSSGLVNVGVANMPVIQFSEQLQSGTINSTNINITLSGNPVAANLTLGVDLKTVTIDQTPYGNLANNKAYYINVTSGVQDLAGNNFSGTQSIPFFTEDGAWNQIYSATSNSDTNMSSPFRVGHKIQAGASPSFVGEQFVKVRVLLSQLTTPLSGRASGLVVQLRKASDNSVIHFTRPFTAFMDARNDLSGISSPSAFDFYNSDNTYATQADDKIEVQWLSGLAIEVGYSSSNVNNAVIWTQYTGGTYSGSSYAHTSSRDLGGILWAR